MDSVRLPARLAEITEVHNFVEQIGAAHSLDERTLHTLHLVLEEACTNVIVHAYQGQGGQMEIAFEKQSDCLRVIIHDWGTPFDPAEVPVPDISAPLDERPLGGLGVYLLREMMDDVQYQFSAKDGNTLTMVKKLPNRSGIASHDPSANIP